MSGRITPHQIAVACGTGGAYIEVTAYVEFGEGIQYGWGRSDQFSDVAPGTFTFTLSNADGRFTPGNTATPLPTPLVEGMGVSWLLGTRLVHTTILGFEVPSDEARWDQIVITCDDMLGNAGRFQLTNLPDMLLNVAGPQLIWRLDESSGVSSAEAGGSLLGPFVTSRVPSTSTSSPTLGVTPHAGLPGAAVTITAQPGETIRYGTVHANKAAKTSIPYPKVTSSTSHSSQPGFGWWGFWGYPGSTLNFSVSLFWTATPARSDSMQVILTPSTVSVKGGVNDPVTHTFTTAEAGVPHYYVMRPYLAWTSTPGAWWQYVILYMDGQYLGQTLMQAGDPSIADTGYTIPPALLADGSAMQPVEVALTVTNPSSATTALSGTAQRVAHTLTSVPREYQALFTTEDQRRATIDFIDPTITSATWTGTGSQPLSTDPIGYPDISGSSALDVYNAIIRTEAGHLFCTTTGTLTAPVEQVQVRARDRPQTAKAVFDVSLDGVGIPALARDLSNLAQTIDVQGPDRTVTVTDTTIAALTTRYLAGGVQETILGTDPQRMREWGSDRINRGKNTALNVTDLTVDAFTTPTDRTADLLGLIPGDRISLSGFPAARLGYSVWDGTVLSGSETHGIDHHEFKFGLAPVLPATLVVDTDVLANGGDITLTADVSSTATTLQVVSASGETWFAPSTVTIESEQLRVTAASATTLTVTRGANGTTAAAHALGAALLATGAHVLAY